MIQQDLGESNPLKNPHIVESWYAKVATKWPFYTVALEPQKSSKRNDWVHSWKNLYEWCIGEIGKSRGLDLKHKLDHFWRSKLSTTEQPFSNCLDLFNSGQFCWLCVICQAVVVEFKASLGKTSTVQLYCKEWFLDTMDMFSAFISATWPCRYPGYRQATRIHGIHVWTWQRYTLSESPPCLQHTAECHHGSWKD